MTRRIALKAPRRLRRHTPLVLTLLTLLAIVVSLVWVFFRAPQDAVMGHLQRIFYFHVASAYAMYVSAVVCGVGSALYLLRGKDIDDALASAGAQTVLLFGGIVLVTGPIWASKAWGTYWTWDPRLTMVLITQLVYVGFVSIRHSLGESELSKRVSACVGVLGTLNIPLIHLAVRAWGGQHPEVITGSGGGLQHVDMKIALGLSIVAFTFLTAVLLWTSVGLHLAQTRVRRLRQQLASLPSEQVER